MTVDPVRAEKGCVDVRWQCRCSPELGDEFASESEAVAAFEVMELEKLKAGETITNFHLWHPDRPDQ